MCKTYFFNNNPIYLPDLILATFTFKIIPSYTSFSHFFLCDKHRIFSSVKMATRKIDWGFYFFGLFCVARSQHEMTCWLQFESSCWIFSFRDHRTLQLKSVLTFLNQWDNHSAHPVNVKKKRWVFSRSRAVHDFLSWKVSTLPLKTVGNSSVVVRDPAVITSSDPLIEIRVSLKQQLIFALCTSLWPVVSAQYEWSEQDF